MNLVRQALPLVALVLLSSGCFVSSLHPVYDDESIVFDESLIGTWEIRESEVSAVISRGEWRSYHVAFTDRFGTTRLTGHLTTLGTGRLFNVRLEDGLERPAFLVATNGFMQIEIEAERLRVRDPDYATVLKRLQAGKLGIDAAIDLKQNVILTPGSAKLRTWLRGALQDPSLWAEWKTFTRSAR